MRDVEAVADITETCSRYVQPRQEGDPEDQRRKSCGPQRTKPEVKE